MCVCCLIQRADLENVRVRISKANMTFWAHLNCCYYGWRQMMSLPIKPQPLRKLPVVWRCPCHTAEKLLFLLHFFVCVRLCVCTVLHALVYEMSHQCWTRGSLPLSQRLFWSHSFTWLPQACWPRGLAQQPLPSTRTGPNIVLEQRARKDCKPVLFRHLLSIDSFDSQLWTETHHKDFLRAHCVCGLQLFVETIADVELWRHF